MPLIINDQFIDATNPEGGTVLIRELENETAGRCGWTVLRE